MSPKTGTSPDKGAEFQYSLTVAMAKGATSKDVPQFKVKAQIQEVRPQLLEIKRKVAASGVIALKDGVADTPALKQHSSASATQTVGLPPTQETLPLSPDGVQSTPGDGADPAGGRASSLLSATAISSIVQVPTQISTGGNREIQASKGSMASASAGGTPERVTHETAQPIADARSSHPKLETMPDSAPQPQGENLSAAVPASPVLQRPQATDLTAIPSGPIAATNKVIPDAIAVATAAKTIPATSAEMPAAAKTISVTLVPVDPAVAIEADSASSGTAPAKATANDCPETQGIVSAVRQLGPIASAPTISAAPAPRLPAPKAADIGQTSQSPNAADIGQTPQAPNAADIDQTRQTPKVADIDQTRQAPKAADIGQTPQVSKAGYIGQTPQVSKADVTEPSVAVTAVDPSTLTGQQSSTLVGQSAIAPPSVSGLSVVLEPQGKQATGVSSAPYAGRVADAAQQAASPRASSAAKAKPVAGASTTGSRSTDSSGTQDQTGSVSTSSVLPAFKAGDASILTGQNSSVPKSALEVQTVAQMTQVNPSSGAGHAPQFSQGVGGTSEAAVQTLPPLTVPESQPMQGVNSAQLIQSIHSSEMKLGMQSAEFGNISISTSLNREVLSARISIDHAELGRAMAVHLPAIEEKLGSAYGVQAKVELRDGNSAPLSNQSGYSNSGQQAKEHRQSQGGRSAVPQGGVLERSAARTVFTQVSPTASASRLDVRV